MMTVLLIKNVCCCFLIDNIFVEFGWQNFQQSVGIPMGTNCPPLLADLFLYTFEANFIQTIQNSRVKNRLFLFEFHFPIY